VGELAHVAVRLVHADGAPEQIEDAQPRAATGILDTDQATQRIVLQACEAAVCARDQDEGSGPPVAERGACTGRVDDADEPGAVVLVLCRASERVGFLDQAALVVARPGPLSAQHIDGRDREIVVVVGKDHGRPVGSARHREVAALVVNVVGVLAELVDLLEHRVAIAIGRATRVAVRIDGAPHHGAVVLVLGLVTKRVLDRRELAVDGIRQLVVVDASAAP
jgi:hypothetical protein